MGIERELKLNAKKNKPDKEGWYLWWDEPEDTVPFHVLAQVKVHKDQLCVNLNWDTNANDWPPLSEVADRLWLRVSDSQRRR